MEKNILTFLILLGWFNTFSQTISSNTTLMEIKVLDTDSRIRESRNVEVVFQVNKKTSLPEATLEIKRIKKKVKVTTIDSGDSDTLRYEGESFEIDTDFPVPTGEHDQVLIENTMEFVKYPVVLQMNDNEAKKPTKKGSSSNKIVAFYLQKIPIINDISFLSPLELNFSSELSSKIDSVKSDSYSGVFISEYNKLNNGYSIEGKFRPVKSITQKGDSNFAETEWEIFNYSGFIETLENKIVKLTLNVETKSKTTFRGMLLGDSESKKYKLEISNTFIDR